MHSKIVENWLTNIGELTFTIPFCQLLLSMGQRVIHVSSQGPMEQGKDVISVSQNRQVHCYQLKSGNINNKVWGEIKSEIDDLVELPPKHPSLPAKVKSWKAYLVTNGTIANPVARTIHDYSQAKREKGYQELTTIVRGELLSDFIQHFGNFLPVEIDDMRSFLELYSSPGDGSLDCEKFKRFFELFFTRHSAGSRQKKIEAIRAALILASYTLTYKYVAGNRIEIIKAYLLLLASIYHHSEVNNLDARLWKDTESLIYDAIEIEFRQLIDELSVHSSSFVEANGGLLSESIIRRLRCNEIVGYLSAYINYCRIRGVEPYRLPDIEDVLAEAKRCLVVVGECVVPLLVNFSLALYAMADVGEAVASLAGLLNSILQANVEPLPGLPSPYYDMSQCLKLVLGLNDERNNESFRLRSFCLHSLILLLAQLGERNLLAAVWRPISVISQSVFIPDMPVDYLKWRVKTGVQDERFADAPQSWERLVEEARTDRSSLLPSSLNDRRYFLPFLINVMPHRFNSPIVMAMFESIKLSDIHRDKVSRPSLACS